MAIRYVIPALLILVIPLLPFLAPWIKVVLIIALAKGIAVLGVTILLRAGQVSFGHALFFAIAAYSCAFLARTSFGGEFFVMLIVGVLAAAISGLLVGLFVVRYRGIFFGMLNLAFSMIFWSVLEKFYYLTGGADGIHVSRPSVLGFILARSEFETFLFYFTFVLALLLGWVALRFLNSPIGHLFQTVKTNETRLQYLGISPRRTLLVGYVLSTALCGVGGVILASVQGIVTPDYAWWIRSGEMVFIAVLGGLGSVPGAFIGALAYELVRTYAATFAADIWQMVLGAFLLGIILFAPGGMIGIYDAVMRRLFSGGEGPAEKQKAEASPYRPAVEGEEP